MHRVKKKVWRGGVLQSSSQAVEAVTLNKPLTVKKKGRKETVIWAAVQTGADMKTDSE